jgi:hypothetical protein
VKRARRADHASGAHDGEEHTEPARIDIHVSNPYMSRKIISLVLHAAMLTITA